MGIFNEQSRFARIWDQRVAGPIQQHITGRYSPSRQGEKTMPTTQGQQTQSPPQPVKSWYAPRRFSDKIALQKKRQEDLEKILNSEVVAPVDPNAAVPHIVQADPDLSLHPAAQLQMHKERLAHEFAQENMQRMLQRQQQQQQFYQPPPQPPPDYDLQRRMSYTSQAAAVPAPAVAPPSSVGPCARCTTAHAPMPYGSQPHIYPPCMCEPVITGEPRPYPPQAYAHNSNNAQAPRPIPDQRMLIRTPSIGGDDAPECWDAPMDSSAAASSGRGMTPNNNSFSIASLLSCSDVSSCSTSVSATRQYACADSSTSGYGTPGYASGHVTPYHDPTRWRERGGSMRVRRQTYAAAPRPDEAFVSRRATSVKAVSRAHMARQASGHFASSVPATIDYGALREVPPSPVPLPLAS